MGSIALLLRLPYTFAQSSSPPLNQSTTCNEQCQQLVQLGIAFEASSHAHTPLDEFYSIPDTFNPSMKPGTLLRVEIHTSLTNYTVPSGLTMSRIMYTSQNLNGTVVPASAYVLWPYTPFQYTDGDKWHGRGHQKQQAPSKFPLVAWSHGTSGFFVNCAPSNYRSLQYHFMTSYSLALEGFAVVATDYAGLGVTTRPDGEQSHEWLAGPSGANDVAYAIKAARRAFPDQLDKDGPFIAMGHSQGGNVAWSFAERQVKSPVPGYRGTISISPPTRILGLVDNALTIGASTSPSSWPLWVPVVLGLQPTIIASITAVYPSYNFSGMTPISYDRWNNVLKPLQGCLPTDSLAFADVNLNQLAKPGWTNDSIAQQWQEKAAVSGKNFKGPLLVIAGENDVVPVDFLEQSVGASCSASGNQSLEMFTYQAMEHFPAIQASRTKWMSWIKDRIGGGDGDWARRGTGVCGKNSFVEGFNTNYTLQSVTPNWLVDWVASPQEGWKLSL
jgi:pimeloyl-ACP methyl ester carboxylesterase